MSISFMPEAEICFASAYDILTLDSPDFETEVDGVGWIYAKIDQTDSDLLIVQIEIQTEWWDEHRVWEYRTTREQIEDGFWADYVANLIGMMEEGQIG